MVPEECCQTVRNIPLPEKTPLSYQLLCCSGWSVGGPRREQGSSNWPLETLPCAGWNQPRANEQLYGNKMLRNSAGSPRSCLLLCRGYHPFTGNQPVCGEEQLRLCGTVSEKQTLRPIYFPTLVASRLLCPYLTLLESPFHMSHSCCL